jgi:hypothetical protein
MKNFLDKHTNTNLVLEHKTLGIRSRTVLSDFDVHLIIEALETYRDFGKKVETEKDTRNFFADMDRLINRLKGTEQSKEIRKFIKN